MYQYAEWSPNEKDNKIAKEYINSLIELFIHLQVNIKWYNETMLKNSRTDFTFVIPNTRWHKGGEGRYWNHIPYPEGILTAVLRKMDTR